MKIGLSNADYLLDKPYSAVLDGRGPPANSRRPQNTLTGSHDRKDVGRVNNVVFFHFKKKIDTQCYQMLKKNCTE